MECLWFAGFYKELQYLAQRRLYLHSYLRADSVALERSQYRYFYSSGFTRSQPGEKPVALLMTLRDRAYCRKDRWRFLLRIPKLMELREQRPR